MSVNKVILIGNLGNDPEFKSFQNGEGIRKKANGRSIYGKGR